MSENDTRKSLRLQDLPQDEREILQREAKRAEERPPMYVRILEGRS